MLNFAIDTAKGAGSILMEHFGHISSYKHKSTPIDLLTIADIQSEEFIINEIKTTFPDHHIIAEESAIIDNKSDYRWVIDPLDGTTNFVHNLPIFAVSIGLQYKEETIVAVVYNPAADKCFWAEKNGGAFLNGIAIQTTLTNTLSSSLLVTGFPYSHDDRWNKGFDLFKALYGKTQGVRRLGAAALDFCFVAMGRFEGFWEFGLQPWDVCAGALIVQEAGGKVSDWDSSPMPFSGNRVLATNSHIHKELLELLSEDLI
ncbi:MAG: inositol monophosphatase [Candidatus Marinimicrobia bacterium]|nr:inositol monophosphatase [Candidatus Neomarinimicrobiota bacterium]